MQPLTEFLVQLRRVTVKFGPTVALKDASLSVRHGEVACIVGPNGSGKSTLAAVLMGTIPPLGGQVYWEGTDVSFERPQDRWRRGVVIVPEGRAVLAELTVDENVRLGAGPGSIRRVRAHAARALAAVPALLELRGRRGDSLSGGQQQLVALCRALASEPRLLILDEPLLGLDASNQDLIIKGVNALRDSRTNGMSVIVLEAEPLWPTPPGVLRLRLKDGNLADTP